MPLHPRDFVLVGANAVQVGAVRSREQIARLKEVNVSVDVTRQNELAAAINLFSERPRILFAYRDAFDFVAVDYHRCIGQDFAVSRVDHRSANERNFLSAERRAEECEREYERNSKFHSRDSSTSLGMTKAILSIPARLSLPLGNRSSNVCRRKTVFQSMRRSDKGPFVFPRDICFRQRRPTPLHLLRCKGRS